jgi:hypothetical protein
MEERMNITKSFTFMFEDPDWLRKLGIGTLVMLLGLLFSPVLIGLIPLIIIAGYGLDVTRNVLQGNSSPLPAWEEWGNFLMRGLKLVGAMIVWALPMIVPMIPLFIGAAISENTNNGALSGMGSLLMLCGSCLVFLWGIVLLVLSPAIYVRLAQTDRFTSAFEFGQLWSFTRTNISNVIVAILLSLLAGVIASVVAPLGAIALLVGALVTTPLALLWTTLVQSHLYGQVGAASPATL